MTPVTKLILPTAAAAALCASAVFAQSARDGSRTYSLELTGEAEVADADPDGTGTATITVSVPKKEVCYELEVSGIQTATAAHIHRGEEGVAGPVVIPLTAPSAGTSSGCVFVSARLAAQILARPDQYYVNVHNAEFPAGAVRAQLG